MDQLTDVAVAAASSPWVYAIVFALTVLDAFLVVVPSETVIVALGALALSSGSPQLGLLVPVAAAAAVLGDSLTYRLGRTVGLARFGWMRSPKAVRVFAWAHRSLDRRAAALLMTARFVPFGRVAVNLVAGATGFAYPRFLALTSVAGLCWAVYNTVVGAVFGAWFAGSPLLAVGTSVVVAVALGVALDRASARLASSRNRPTASGSKNPSRSRPARGTKDTDRQTGGSNQQMSTTLECIAEWISRQRWYAGKGHEPRLRELSRELIPSDDPNATVSIVLVMDDEGHVPTLYQVPIVERDELQPAERPFLIGRGDGGRYVFDGPHDPAYPVALLRLLAPEFSAQVTVTGSRVLSGEQSNTSIIFDIDGVPSVICKVFRALHHGDNPDVTLQAALSDAGSTAVPRFIGQLGSEWDDVGRPNGRASGHLAFAQEFLADSDDGWRVALRFASDGTDFTGLARGLGEKTAEVHQTLAQVMPTNEASEADIESFVDSWRSRLALAAREVPALLEQVEAIEAIYEAAHTSAWPRLQRIHGDFHLGQALLAPERGWVLVDFEGEPLRPMDERDRPDVALRDVAGMLRSFEYAAASTPGVAADWASESRAAFLAGYAATSGIDLDAVGSLLGAFELDKAVYEAVYEARNRPDWLAIPLRGIDQLVAAQGARDRA